MRLLEVVKLAAALGLPVLDGACSGGVSHAAHATPEAPSPARADTVPPKVVTQPIVLQMEVPAGSLLSQLQLWRARDAEPGIHPEYGPVALELMRLESEAGNYAAAHRLADRVYGAASPDSGERAYPADGWTAVDAVPAIAEHARGSRIVMVNEAHHAPQHRAFSIALLRALRAEGFTHLAVETLFASDTLLNERKYPVRASGAYIAEPVYGDLVRTALRLGYRVVAYENATAAQPGGREEGQARNLVRRTLEADPHARVLVHAGYRHINESGLLAGVPPMAMVVKRLTGLDPLTIDQTEMTEHSTSAFEHPIYRRAADAGVVTRPTVFRSASGALWTLKDGLRDVTVFHPRTILADGRPTWLRLGGWRVAHHLDAHACGVATHCLVEARFVSESVDAVPIDQVEVTPASAPALMLPAGEFLITARAADGAVLDSARVRIDAASAAP